MRRWLLVRSWAPFANRPLPNLRTSGLGAALKRNVKWRVIFHLSAPYGSSINDDILKEKLSLHLSMILSGSSTLMAQVQSW